MYNQLGGNVIWTNDSTKSTWKELPGQEYSVLEKNLLIKLNAIPNITSVTKSGPNKGRVKNLHKWWNNCNQTYPMTTSFHNLIKDKSFDELVEISFDLTEIINRREQDRAKLIHLTGDKGHKKYLNSLISAREYVRTLKLQLKESEQNTSEHKPSPLRIDPKVSSQEASKLSQSDTGKLSHSATEFVPKMPLAIPSTVAEAPMLPYTPTQQFYYPHLHPMFDPSLYDLFYDSSSQSYYWLNKLTNEVIYVTPHV
tara:strand:+ start:475 stop:1236 length:762 start_codon:yes stop_codon:yes gene_type:complete